jgi:hypothetical protein
MTQQHQITITLTAEEQALYTQQAREQGYKSLEDFVKATLQAAVEPDDDDIDPEKSLKRGWRDAMGGRHRPYTEFLKEFADDDATQ